MSWLNSELDSSTETLSVLKAAKDKKTAVQRKEEAIRGQNRDALSLNIGNEKGTLTLKNIVIPGDRMAAE